MTYNLSICGVDGETVYGLIGTNHKLLWDFLNLYDHEGSSVSMVIHPDDCTFTTIEDPDVIYRMLRP